MVQNNFSKPIPHLAFQPYESVSLLPKGPQFRGMSPPATRKTSGAPNVSKPSDSPWTASETPRGSALGEGLTTQQPRPESRLRALSHRQGGGGRRRCVRSPHTNGGRADHATRGELAEDATTYANASPRPYDDHHPTDDRGGRRLEHASTRRRADDHQHPATANTALATSDHTSHTARHPPAARTTLSTTRLHAANKPARSMAHLDPKKHSPHSTEATSRSRSTSKRHNELSDPHRSQQST